MPPKRPIGEVNSGGDDQTRGEWSEYVVVDLKLELGKRGLSQAGRKADLVARLKAADEISGDGTATIASVGARSVGDSPATAPRLKAKRARKSKSPDPEIEGPLASEIIIHQHMNHTTREHRLREFVPEPDGMYPLCRLYLNP